MSHMKWISTWWGRKPPLGGLVATKLLITTPPRRFSCATADLSQGPAPMPIYLCGSGCNAVNTGLQYFWKHQAEQNYAKT